MSHDNSFEKLLIHQNFVTHSVHSILWKFSNEFKVNRAVFPDELNCENLYQWFIYHGKELIIVGYHVACNNTYSKALMSIKISAKLYDLAGSTENVYFK